MLIYIFFVVGEWIGARKSRLLASLCITPALFLRGFGMHTDLEARGQTWPQIFSGTVQLVLKRVSHLDLGSLIKLSWQPSVFWEGFCPPFLQKRQNNQNPQMCPGNPCWFVGVSGLLCYSSQYTQHIIWWNKKHFTQLSGIDCAWRGACSAYEVCLSFLRMLLLLACLRFADFCGSQEP